MGAPLDILALDVATSTGLCRGRAGEVPSFATKTFRGDDHLNICASAIRWIAGLLREEPLPDVAYIEKPLPLGVTIRGRSNSAAIVRLNTLYGILGGACLLRGVRVVGVDVQQARQAFIGDGRIDRDEAKRRCLAMCRILGWPANNLDEGDAACVWYWGCCCENPKVAAVVHPGLHRKVSSLTLAGVG